MAKVDLALLLELNMRLNEIQEEILEAQKGGLFCSVCGETSPEGGFLALGMPDGSICNKCAGKALPDFIDLRG